MDRRSFQLMRYSLHFQCDSGCPTDLCWTELDSLLKQYLLKQAPPPHHHFTPPSHTGSLSSGPLLPRFYTQRHYRVFAKWHYRSLLPVVLHKLCSIFLHVLEPWAYTTSLTLCIRLTWTLIGAAFFPHQTCFPGVPSSLTPCQSNLQAHQKGFDAIAGNLSSHQHCVNGNWHGV